MYWVFEDGIVIGKSINLVNMMGVCIIYLGIMQYFVVRYCDIMGLKFSVFVLEKIV